MKAPPAAEEAKQHDMYDDFLDLFYSLNVQYMLLLVI